MRWQLWNLYDIIHKQSHYFHVETSLERVLSKRKIRFLPQYACLGVLHFAWIIYLFSSIYSICQLCHLKFSIAILSNSEQSRPQRNRDNQHTTYGVIQQIRGNAGFMLCQRRWRWHNINPTLDDCLVHAVMCRTTSLDKLRHLFKSAGDNIMTKELSCHYCVYIE